jgi:acyl CoA:acetate/3-ketoacid CoA transferase
MVNLGAGIPMYDVPEAARGLGRGDIYFTVEQGPMDGWPKAGGVSRHPGVIMPQLDVFDFYEGGGR